MPDEKDPTEEAGTGEKEEKTEEKAEKTEKPSFESLAAQNKELNDKLEKVLKQNSDKDSHITRIQGENKTLRDKISTVSSSLEGKSEIQKDAILEKNREKFLEAGYDEKAVDLILTTIADIADKKAETRITKVVTDAAMELIESDKDIDQAFVKANETAIMGEYNLLKLPEVSARSMKANFKKAYKSVKDALSEKAKGTRKGQDEDRDAMIDGARPAPVTKKPPKEEEDFVKSIESSGATNSHFM